jgi:hypothetical protein
MSDLYLSTSPVSDFDGATLDKKTSPIPFIIAVALFLGGIFVSYLGITEFGLTESKGWLLPLVGYLLSGFGVPLMFGWDKIRQQKIVQNPDAYFTLIFERLLLATLVPSLLVSAWNLWWLSDFIATLVTEIVRGG